MAVAPTAGHRHGTEIFGTHRLARSMLVAMCNRSLSTRPAGCSEVSIVTRSRSETGAATVPGLTRAAVNCRRWTRRVPGLLCFRRSVEWVDNPWGRSGTFSSGQGVAVPTPGRCDHALVIQSTGTRAAAGPHPGLRVSLGFRLVGMRGVAAGDHEGNLASPSLDSLPHRQWWLVRSRRWPRHSRLRRARDRRGPARCSRGGGARRGSMARGGHRPVKGR